VVGEVEVRLGPFSGKAEEVVLDNMRRAYKQFPFIIAEWMAMLKLREAAAAAAAAAAVVTSVDAQEDDEAAAAAVVTPLRAQADDEAATAAPAHDNEHTCTRARTGVTSHALATVNVTNEAGEEQKEEVVGGAGELETLESSRVSPSPSSSLPASTSARTPGGTASPPHLLSPCTPWWTLQSRMLRAKVTTLVSTIQAIDDVGVGVGVGGGVGVGVGVDLEMEVKVDVESEGKSISRSRVPMAALDGYPREDEGDKGGEEGRVMAAAGDSAPDGSPRANHDSDPEGVAETKAAEIIRPEDEYLF
jgi:hypothetical protein